MSDKRITIRMNNADYMELEKESKYRCISISELIRDRLSNGLSDNSPKLSDKCINFVDHQEKYRDYWIETINLLPEHFMELLLFKSKGLKSPPQRAMYLIRLLEGSPVEVSLGNNGDYDGWKAVWNPETEDYYGFNEDRTKKVKVIVSPDGKKSARITEDDPLFNNDFK